MSPVTVVIPALNAASTIADQLKALVDQEGAPSFSVIVVDNGSVDDTAAVASAFDSAAMRVTVVSETRRGINPARNAGIAAAEDGVILLCDADDRVCAAWVRLMADAVDAEHWAAGAVDYAAANDAATLELWGAQGAGVGVPIISEPYVDDTFGCSCGFAKEMWRELGGFNPGLSSAGDEHEFFMRAHARGYRPRVVPDALVAYRLRSGTRAWLRHRYTTGRSVGRAARCEGGVALRAQCRPSRAVPRLIWTIAAFPAYAWSATARRVWAGGVLRRWGHIVGWFSGRDLAAGQGR